MLEQTRNAAGDVLTIAFATAVVIWLLIYVTIMPGGIGIPMVAVVLGGATLLAGGWFAARSTGRGVAGGAVVGATVGGINLLILGSLLSDETRSIVTSGLLWTGVSTVAAIVLGMIGAAAGRRDVPLATTARWSGRFAFVLVVATALMMVAGGLVTGLEAGMAFPDWLTTDGYPMVLFPARLMTASIDGFVEHAHRLWGLLVGLTAIAFAVHAFAARLPRIAKTLAIVVLATVIIQGVLGGTRVLGDSLAMAIVHGVFGQLVFGLIAVLATVCAIGWIEPGAPISHEKGAKLRYRAISLFWLLVTQLVIGALYRHLNAAPTVAAGMSHGLLGLHLLVAFGVLGQALLTGGTAWGTFREHDWIRRLGGAMLLLVGLQFAFGIGALIAVLARQKAETIPMWEVLLTTAHQTNGSLLLACAASLTVWARRVVA